MPIPDIFQKYYNNEIDEKEAIKLIDSDEAKETLMELWDARIIPHSYFGIS